MNQAPQPALTPEQKRAEWEKLCKESKGKSLLLSGDTEQAAKDFQAKLDAHVKLTLEYNKANAIFDNVKENYFFDLRTELEKAGMKDVWEKGLVFNSDAVKEGFMVIHVNDNQ